ncbi:MAG: hypothetical protein DWQ06_05420 [Calditrichaeota bacterium]|nr:MAG: hypothetical protein DWQ06_05420 [Calditrichota bacterium]
MKLSESLASRDERFTNTVIQMMRSQSYRELVAAQMFGYGLQFVPDRKLLKFMAWHVQEETTHYIDVAKLYEKHVGESVEPWVHARIAQKPMTFAESWLELAIAQWLYDRGGFWQLQEYEECSWEPYQTIVEKIIKEERGHQDLGQKYAVELCKELDDMTEAQGMFNKWLKQGLLSFGRPKTEGNEYAISVGLKKRDSGEVMKDFMLDVFPAIREAGLQLPPIESLGMEFPDDIPWEL